MTLIFTLSMPGSPSWNGKWSGAGNLYAITKKISRSRKAEEKAQKLAETGYFSYSWPDGWRAAIHVRIAKDSSEVRMVKKASRGFCGYEWMVSNILSHGDPRDLKDIPKEVAA